MLWSADGVQGGQFRSAVQRLQRRSTTSATSTRRRRQGSRSATSPSSSAASAAASCSARYWRGLTCGSVTSVPRSGWPSSRPCREACPMPSSTGRARRWRYDGAGQEVAVVVAGHTRGCRKSCGATTLVFDDDPRAGLVFILVFIPRTLRHAWRAQTDRAADPAARLALACKINIHLGKLSTVVASHLSRAQASINRVFMPH
jgi:hypothetical protein